MPFKSRPYFTQKWQDGLAASREMFMPCQVRIFDQGESEYDPATNTYGYPNLVELYVGKARVQPIRSAVSKLLPQDNTAIQTVLISVPIGEVQDIDFRGGLQARVTECLLFPSLKSYQFALLEIMDSGNPAERTLLFTVDQEQVVTDGV